MIPNPFYTLEGYGPCRLFDLGHLAFEPGCPGGLLEPLV